MGWDGSDFLGVYDDWLNYTGSYMLDRKLITTDEIALIVIGNYAGTLTLVKMTITNDLSTTLTKTTTFDAFQETSIAPVN